MPSVDIVRSVKVPDSFRVQQVRGRFDLTDPVMERKWSVNLPLEDKPWKIGCIHGSSGSGKSTIASELFKDFKHHSSFSWDTNKAFIECMAPKAETSEVTGMLVAVGLSSPPHWLKPFRCLSNGQKFRAELARLLLESDKGTVFDEFTSVVDRNVAKVASSCLEKHLRSKKAPPFVAVTCHSDVLEWLRPDWTFDTDNMVFEWRRRRPRPQVEIGIHEAKVGCWKMFREHHYLTHGIALGVKAFVAFWGDEPVGFTSARILVHPHYYRAMIEHRTVVLPDYQGMGIGSRLCEWMAQAYVDSGFGFFSTTSSPPVTSHRSRSSLWRTVRIGRNLGSTDQFTSQRKWKDDSPVTKWRGSGNRITASFEYVGKPLDNPEHVIRTRRHPGLT